MCTARLSFRRTARPRTDAAMQTMRTNHGGICLFYRSTISAREVPLPKCKSGLEARAVYFYAARRTALVVILYRPGSDAVSNVFFDDLDDILGQTSTYACPMIMMGDLNLHLDVTLDPSAVRCQTAIESYGLLQHISSPTHRAIYSTYSSRGRTFRSMTLTFSRLRCLIIHSSRCPSIFSSNTASRPTASVDVSGVT